jgi:hypothetical protein
MIGDPAVPPSAPERRREQRDAALLGASVVRFGDDTAAATLTDISAAGAYVVTSARPPLGATVTLLHAQAGHGVGTVSRHGADGIAIAFPLAAHSVDFALRVVGLAMQARAALQAAE